MAIYRKLDHRFRNFHPLVLILAILGVSAWYLSPGFTVFPLDDAYIHFTYANNLADHGQIFFLEPTETGVGSTSILWIGLLTAGIKLGLSVSLVARILGIGSLILLALALYEYFRPKLGVGYSSLATLLVTLSGHLIWFALSGMETVLFLVLGFLALIFYRRGQWARLGISLGFLVLARPEGLALAVLIGTVEVVRSKKIRKELLLAAAITAVISLPWFLFLFGRTGSILPTSAIGKQLSYTIAIQYGLSSHTSLSFLNRIPGLTYVFLWSAYLLEFVLGGASYPGPHFILNTRLSHIHYPISYWAIGGWVLAFVPLAWTGLKRFIRAKAWTFSNNFSQPHPILMILLWAVLNNLLYAAFLPIPGTASRYGAINHVFLWASLVYLIPRMKLAQTFRPLFWAWLIITAVLNTVYWNDVYEANIVHMEQVRIGAAEYYRDHIPAGEFCAVSDIGAISYFSDRPFFDLGGIIDPELKQIFLDGRLAEHVRDSGVTCLIVPGRTGNADDGFLDFSVIMGFTSNPYFDMEALHLLEIDRETWLRGYLPTMNYQATAAIYRLHLR